MPLLCHLPQLQELLLNVRRDPNQFDMTVNGRMRSGGGSSSVVRKLVKAAPQIKRLRLGNYIRVNAKTMQFLSLKLRKCEVFEVVSSSLTNDDARMWFGSLSAHQTQIFGPPLKQLCICNHLDIPRWRAEMSPALQKRLTVVHSNQSFQKTWCW